MASIIYKTKRGRRYAYWVRSARVNGRPRIVEQLYLGPRDRFLQQIKLAYSGGKGAARVPLRRVGCKEFGASALLWHWAERLDLVGIVDRHVPAVPNGRRTRYSVGQYLVLAAINRAIAPRSKRAMYAWFETSVLSRLWPARRTELTSQRFWDHMDQVKPEHIEAIQRDVAARLAQEFSLGEETVLYDSTNFFTYIDTFNERSALAQRGHNKQKRHDLRQLSLGLFEDAETGLPVRHECYQGNRNDVTEFPDAWQGLLKTWTTGLERQPKQLTLVFDRGNVSRPNLEQLEDRSVRYVGGVPRSWMPDLLDVPGAEYHTVDLPGRKHVSVHRERRMMWGKERTVLVVLSPSFYAKQRAAMNREQAKADEKLTDLAAAIERWRTNRHGRGHSEIAVRRKIQRWVAREHLREYRDMDLQIEGSRAIQLQWKWNPDKKQHVQERYLGKQILVTNRDDWDDATIVSAYRRLTRTENLFRISKSRPGLWWPMFHWTDSKIRVHALYCFLALILLGVVRLQLREAGVDLATEEALSSLQSIHEALVVYADGSFDRVLSDMNETELRIAKALRVPDVAAAMGTTVLGPR
jgi:transposase